MRIGIISDTHFDSNCDKLKDFLRKYMQDVDMIIHAGDYTNPKVVKIIKDFKPFHGVCGNVDSKSVKDMLNEKDIFTVCGYRVGVYHGEGDEKATLSKIMDVFKDDRLDILIFGHTHRPYTAVKGRTLLLNPGTVGRKKKERWHSFIILDLSKNTLTSSIRFFN